MNDLIKTEEFDVIIPYIMELNHQPAEAIYGNGGYPIFYREGKRVWIKVRLPANFRLDREKIQQYFDGYDYGIWDSTGQVEFSGTFKDNALGLYIAYAYWEQFNINS